MNTPQAEQDTPISASKTSKRRYHPRSWWFEHYQSWQASGLSKTQYCKINDIRLSSFCNWSVDFSADKNKNATDAPKRPTFIKALVTPDTAEIKPSALVRTLSVQEITLTFDQGVAIDGVAAWITALKKITC